ncbi:MAG: FAD-dependent oxidoreductase [Planctomycetota bacterium]|jgi:choline dehydrogenase-like flavoprotein
MKTKHEYIVVGSGVAGGVISYNLAQAGADCLLIEAGRYLTKETFPRNEADASALLYWGGGLEFSRDARMAFLRGKVVGGSTIVNQALLDRFDEIAFDDWRAESDVDFFTAEAMNPYYDRIEDFLAVHIFEEKERNRNAQLFVKGCETLGYEWHFLHRAHSDCAFERENDCIVCLGGCHRDSKQSTLLTYIRQAERLGLKVQAETIVKRIESLGQGYRLYATCNGQRKEFECRNLILAGGTFGTNQLMLRSGFGTNLPAMGKYFTTHPQFMYFGVYDKEINAHKGMFQTVASKDSRFRQRGFKLENVFAGPVSTALLFNGYGVDHEEFMRNYTRITCAEVAVRDENAGELTVNKKGKLIIEKPLTDQDRRRMHDGVGVLKDILAASGARQVVESPHFFGLHLMGGCRMGTDSKHSVVNPEFEVHGYKNLYIGDASLFPNAPGINPSLTIFALAERLSDQLLGR